MKARGGTQWVVVSAAAAKSRMGNASLVHTRRLPHVPTAVGGTADGTDRSTGDTQNMGESAGTAGLVEPWPRSLPGMPPPGPLAMGWPTVAVKYRYSSKRNGTY